MPDRILRDELGKSGRWLDLKDNTDRCAFVLCIMIADDFGNFEASPGDLIRLWRDVGVNSLETAAKVARELADADLVRFYDHAGKRYGHIPRWRQRLRYYKRAHPRPPPSVECNEIKDMISKKTDHSQTIDGPKSDYSQTVVGRSEVKRSDMKRSEAASDTSSSDAQTSKPVDKNTSQDQGPRPNETATEYAMRLEGLARGIVKPIPK